MRTRTWAIVLLAVLTSSCTRVEASRQPVQVDMANVDLHVSSDVTMHVKELRGSFVPVQRDAPYLDDKTSYSVSVESGDVAIDLASLNTLMFRALGGGNSNIDTLRLSIKDGVLRQQGVIDSTVNVPFTTTATVSVTGDGRIRVRTQSVRGFGVPVRPLMKVFGLKMDDLLKVRPGTGIEVDGNDLIVDPALLIREPQIRGRLTAVRIDGQRLVENFGSGPSRPVAKRPLAANHIYWRGSQLSFGKLTMTDTDLELIDTDPKDPFDFSVDHWKAQLVAGYSKTLPDRGLKAFMPDFNDLEPRRLRR